VAADRRKRRPLRLAAAMNGRIAEEDEAVGKAQTRYVVVMNKRLQATWRHENGKGRGCEDRIMAKHKAVPAITQETLLAIHPRIDLDAAGADRPGFEITWNIQSQEK